MMLAEPQIETESGTFEGQQPPHLSASMRMIAVIGEADRYILAAQAGEPDAPMDILASNWVYDDIVELGGDALARIFRSPFATFPGDTPRPAHPLMLGTFLGPATVAALRRAGDVEYMALKVIGNGARYGVLLSTRHAGRISAIAARKAQLQCCHLLCDHQPPLPDQRGNPLSVREADCLRWVSQGKTTEEVALILGVSANTINSYITQSITKLSASNRAMATAVALRQGFI